MTPFMIGCAWLVCLFVVLALFAGRKNLNR